MNKYQKSLDELVGFAKQHNLIGDIYGKLFVLQEFIDKEEKYRWHDLRKDPNNLPKQVGRYLACCKKRTTIKSYDEVLFIEGKFISSGTVIAWKYIEEFEDE